MALTIIAGIAIAGGVFGEYHFGSAASENALRLEVISDKQVSDAQTLAAHAQLEAGKANERSATLEKQAASLRKQAESERLARVSIERVVAPRFLTEADRNAIAKTLSRFAPSFSGRKVKIRSAALDMEAVLFASEIAEILTKAGIGVEDVGIGHAALIGFAGLEVNGPISDELFIKTLLTSIRSRLNTQIIGNWRPRYTDLEISVGAKPIFGMVIVRLTKHISACNDMADLLQSRVLAVFKAFLDESGHHMPWPDIFTIAGYVSHISKWRRFEMEWKNVLLKSGIKCFHMSECAQRRGEFARFQNDELGRQELIRNLMKVIYRDPPRFYGFACAVDMKAFYRLPDHIKQKFDGDPFFMAFQFAIKQAAYMLENFEPPLPPSEKLALVFDRKSGFEGRALELFNIMKDRMELPYRDRLGSIAFGGKDQFVPLQAADIIAYETHRYLPMRRENKTPRWPMKQILDNPCQCRLIDDESLKRMFAA